MNKPSLLIIGTLLLAACNPLSPSADSPDAPAGEPPLVNITLNWNVTELPTGENDEPSYSLALRLSGDMERTIELGTYTGSFSDEVAGATEDGVTLLHGMGWFAGSGDEFAIQRSAPPVLSILHRFVEEESEIPVYVELQKVGIPSNATISVQ